MVFEPPRSIPPAISADYVVPETPTLSNREARAIALRAQGFGDNSLRTPEDVLMLLGAIQLDSINVVARSHELVPFARIGPYPVMEVYQAIYGRRAGFEYWGHSASWLPMSEYPFFLHRMKRLQDRSRRSSMVNSRTRARYGHLYKTVLDRIRAEGPLPAGAFKERRPKQMAWWNWKPSKRVLEDLFDQGVLMCAARSTGFTRLYDLTERVLPSHVNRQDPGAETSVRHMMKRAVKALGVATTLELADYFRCYRWPAPWRHAIEELVAAGETVRVRVRGWDEGALADPTALACNITVPKHRPTFLSPFDNLVWERKRVERLFEFDLRLESYVPRAQREFGYYVMPLLARGRLRGRADLKFDRKAGALVVQRLWLDGRGSSVEAAIALKDLSRHLCAGSIRLEQVLPRSEQARVGRLV